MVNPPPPHIDKFRSGTIVSHIKCQTYVTVRAYEVKIGGGA